MEQKAVEGGVKRQQRGFTSEEILSFVGGFFVCFGVIKLIVLSHISLDHGELGF